MMQKISLLLALLFLTTTTLQAKIKQGDSLDDSELAAVDAQDGISLDFKGHISILHFAYKNDDVLTQQGDLNFEPKFLKMYDLDGTIEIGETTIDLGLAESEFENSPITAKAIFWGLPKFVEFTEGFKIGGIGIAENFTDKIHRDPNINQGYFMMDLRLSGRFSQTGIVKIFPHNF